MLRGTGPALAEEPETPTLFAVGAVRRSAEPCLRSLRRLWEGSAFALPREGMGLFASKARSGPVPLPLGLPRKRSLVGRVSGPGVRCRPGLPTRRPASVHERMGMRGRGRGALRGPVPTLAEEALGRISVRAAARGNGFVRLQGSLRPGSAAARVSPKKVPCRPGLRTRRPTLQPMSGWGCVGEVVGALRGTVPTFAEEALGRISFRAAARGDGFVRLQGSLRPDPAAARVAPKKVPCRPGLLTRRPL